MRLKSATSLASIAVAVGIVGVFVVFREGVETLDMFTVDRLSSIRYEVLDETLKIILRSDLTRLILQEDPIGSTGFWVLMAVVVGYRRGWKWFAFSMLVLIISQSISWSLKFSLDRPRRTDELALFFRVPELDWDPGFPSGHAQKSFAMALVLARAWPRLSWVWYLVALAVAVERFYVGAHFPTDVFSGIANGVAIGIVLLNPRVFPRVENLFTSLARFFPKRRPARLAV